MDGFKVGQLIVVRINTEAEEKPGIATVHHFVVAELEACQARLSFTCSEEYVPLRSLIDIFDLEGLPVCGPPHEAEPRNTIQAHVDTNIEPNPPFRHHRTERTILKAEFSPVDSSK